MSLTILMTAPADLLITGLARLEIEQPWRTEAACLGEDRELFYPAPGANAPEARAICEGCPVRWECLEDSLQETFGFWGATSPSERDQMRRGMRARGRRGRRAA